jgi:predicted O-methyltransferase YrrM
MRHKEIDLIRTVIDSLGPKNCLEWGSGYSTLYFPSFLPKGSHWLAIEHYPEWAEKISKRNSHDLVKIVNVTPSLPGWKDEGTYEEFKDYVEYPSGQQFDLIIVDGRARLPCVSKSRELISDRGVVMLHDANRLKYRDAEKIMPHSVFFQDRRDGYGGIWMGTNRPPDEIMDIDFFLEVWKMHDELSRRFSVSRTS